MIRLKKMFLCLFVLAGFLNSCETEEVGADQVTSTESQEHNFVTKYLEGEKIRVIPLENGLYSLGDIHLAQEQLTDEPVEYDMTLDPKTASVSEQGVSKWPNNIVPYKWGNISSNGKRKFEDAMAAISQVTSIKFRLRGNESFYVRLNEEGEGGGGVARLGMYNDSYANIGKQARLGTAIHELLHVLGILHEQMRNDRDNYITILTQNIDPRQMHNFDKIRNYDHLNTSYDINSIMHYGSYGFSINGQPTILQKNGSQIPDNQVLTATDIKGINHLYPGDGGGGGGGTTDEISPSPGSTLGSTVNFSWDNPSGAAWFDLIVSSTSNNNGDIRGSSPFRGTSLQVNNLPTNGGTVYVRLWTYDRGWSSKDFTYTAQGGGGNNDICAGVSAWRAGVRYNVGDKVTYQGSLFRRTSSGWRNLGRCS